MTVIMAIIGFLGDSTNFEFNLFLYIHIGFLAISLIFFSLFELKSRIEVLSEKALSTFESESNMQKRDIIQLELTKPMRCVLLAITKICTGFRKCIYGNLVSIILVFIALFFPNNFLLTILCFSTVICLWIILVQVHTFKIIFNFNATNLIQELEKSFDRIDNRDYSLISNPPLIEKKKNLKQSFKDFFSELIWVMRLKKI